ncbi:leucyl aminopeptidase family protein, partial [Staphylococcus capitis]
TEHNIETKINEGQQLGESINYARELSQMPPNILTPQYFAEEIKKHFEGSSVSVDIKDYRQIIDEGFGLIHAVGKGSNHGPRLI